MDTKELLERKAKLNAEVDAIKKEIQAKGHGFFVELLKPLFEASPVVTGFQFTAYTPYFNDGDPCTFSSDHCEGEILLADSTIDWEEANELARPFRDAMSVFMDDDIETFFGDHITVSIYPDRIEVEEYDHD